MKVCLILSMTSNYFVSDKQLSVLKTDLKNSRRQAFAEGTNKNLKKNSMGHFFVILLLF